MYLIWIKSSFHITHILYHVPYIYICITLYISIQSFKSFTYQTWINISSVICFVNHTIQCLLPIPQFYLYILIFLWNSKLKKEEEEDEIQLKLMVNWLCVSNSESYVEIFCYIWGGGRILITFSRNTSKHLPSVSFCWHIRNKLQLIKVCVVCVH